MADLLPKTSRRKSNEGRSDTTSVQDGDVVGVYFSLWPVVDLVDESPILPLDGAPLLSNCDGTGPLARFEVGGDGDGCPADGLQHVVAGMSKGERRAILVPDPFPASSGARQSSSRQWAVLKIELAKTKGRKGDDDDRTSMDMDPRTRQRAGRSDPSSMTETPTGHRRSRSRDTSGGLRGEKKAASFGDALSESQDFDDDFEDTAPAPAPGPKHLVGGVSIFGGVPTGISFAEMAAEKRARQLEKESNSYEGTYSGAGVGQKESFGRPAPAPAPMPPRSISWDQPTAGQPPLAPQQAPQSQRHNSRERQKSLDMDREKEWLDAEKEWQQAVDEKHEKLQAAKQQLEQAEQRHTNEMSALKARFKQEWESRLEKQVAKQLEDDRNKMRSRVQQMEQQMEQRLEQELKQTKDSDLDRNLKMEQGLKQQVERKLEAERTKLSAKFEQQQQEAVAVAVAEAEEKAAEQIASLAVSGGGDGSAGGGNLKAQVATLMVEKGMYKVL
jgi:hypothetical protein